MNAQTVNFHEATEWTRFAKAIALSHPSLAAEVLVCAASPVLSIEKHREIMAAYRGWLVFGMRKNENK